MVRLIEKNPGMGFVAAREQANTLLLRAAGKRVYRMPVVLSAEGEQAQKERLQQRFGPVKEVLAA